MVNGSLLLQGALIVELHLLQFFGSPRPGGTAGGTDFLIYGNGTIAALIAVAVTIFVCYRLAERLVAALGEQGTNVLVRLSAFILLCIGIQILWSGYMALTGSAS